MRFMRRRALAVAAIGASVGALACGDATGTGRVPTVHGNWQLATLISNEELGVICEADGAVAISQSGRNFTGEVTGSSESCTGPGGTSFGDMDGPLLGGQIAGSTLSYSDGPCEYRGDVTGSPANRITGEMSCDIVVQGQSYPFVGSWKLLR